MSADKGEVGCESRVVSSKCGRFYSVAEGDRSLS